MTLIQEGSQSNNRTSKTVGTGFDSQSYLSQLEGSVGEGSLEQGGSPIKTMAEFRKHVISSKKLGQSQVSVCLCVSMCLSTKLCVYVLVYDCQCIQHITTSPLSPLTLPSIHPCTCR